MCSVAVAPTQGLEKLDWHSVPKTLVLHLVPDESGFLEAFLDDLSVGEIGDLLFRSPDKGFYAIVMDVCSRMLSTHGRSSSTTHARSSRTSMPLLQRG